LGIVGLRSWLLFHSSGARATDGTGERRRPIDELVLAIVSASWKCCQEVHPHLPSNHSASRPEQEVNIFREFLYFFLHLMNRYASKRFGDLKAQDIKASIDLLIIPIAVDRFSGRWSKDNKLRIASSFYEKLNDAECEYATCKSLTSTTCSMDESALCPRLASNVMETAGYTGSVGSGLDPMQALRAKWFAKFVQSTALGELNRMHLSMLVHKAGSTMECRSP
jgi:hypothetical protein